MIAHRRRQPVVGVTRTKKPKVQIKQHRGGAYRIYIEGNYVGAGLTRASAREGAKRCSSSTRRQGGARHRLNESASKIHGSEQRQERNYERYAEKRGPH